MLTSTKKRCLCRRPADHILGKQGSMLPDNAPTLIAMFGIAQNGSINAQYVIKLCEPGIPNKTLIVVFSETSSQVYLL